MAGLPLHSGWFVREVDRDANEQYQGNVLLPTRKAV